MPRRKSKWSYSAGEHGRNRVRAYCKGCETACARSSTHPGGLFLEWREDGRRRATSLRVGKDGPPLTDVEEAKRRTDALAAEFNNMPDRHAGPALSVAELLNRYIREATPRKSESKQDHDRRARRVWLAYLHAQPESERRSMRDPASMDRLDWERFADWRRQGRIPGFPRRCRNKIIHDDLSFFVTALNWAVGAGLLDRNPWDGSIRRAQHWPRYRELNPHRPGMPDWIRDGLLAHSRSWQFRAALLLERETRRRNGAIRRLVWSDVDLAAGTIRWRSEADKSGRENVTPVTAKALEVLRSLPSRGIGAVPLFPGEDGQPASRHSFQRWLRRAKAAWLRSIEDPTERERVRLALRGVGYHAEKRAGVRDPGFRSLPPAIQEEIAGTDYSTLRRIYDEVTPEDVREAWPEAARIGTHLAT